MEKGTTNNPNGRPKGTPNKITTTVRTWIVDLINNNREQIENDLKALDPKDRLSFIEKMLPYILPRVVKADEVEGAAYTKEDVVTSSLLTNWDDFTGRKTVQSWIAKTN